MVGRGTGREEGGFNCFLNGSGSRDLGSVRLFPQSRATSAELNVSGFPSFPTSYVVTNPLPDGLWTKETRSLRTRTRLLFSEAPLLLC